MEKKVFKIPNRRGWSVGRRAFAAAILVVAASCEDSSISAPTASVEERERIEMSLQTYVSQNVNADYDRFEEETVYTSKTELGNDTFKIIPKVVVEGPAGSTSTPRFEWTLTQRLGIGSSYVIVDAVQVDAGGQVIELFLAGAFDNLGATLEGVAADLSSGVVPPREIASRRNVGVKGRGELYAIAMDPNAQFVVRENVEATQQVFVKEIPISAAQRKVLRDAVAAYMHLSSSGRTTGFDRAEFVRQFGTASDSIAASETSAADISPNSLKAAGHSSPPPGWMSETISFQVTGVAYDDVLNIRASPDYRSDKVGELRFDAKGIRIAECEEGTVEDLYQAGENLPSRWCRLETGGWLNVRFLKLE